MTKTACVGGRLMSNSISFIHLEKKVLRLKKLLKLSELSVTFEVVIKTEIFLSKCLKRKFFKKGKCKDGNCSSMSNNAWCD